MKKVLISMFQSLIILSCTQSTELTPRPTVNHLNIPEKKIKKIKIAYIYNNTDDNLKKNQSFIKSLHLLSKRHEDIEFVNLEMTSHEGINCVIHYNNSNMNHLSIPAEKHINISTTSLWGNKVYNIGIQPNTHLKSLCKSLKNANMNTFSVVTTKSPSVLSDIQNTCVTEGLVMLNKNVASNNSDIMKFISNTEKSTFVDKQGNIINLTHRDKAKLSSIQKQLKLEKLHPDILIFAGNVNEFNVALKYVKPDQKILFIDGINTDPKTTLEKIDSNKPFYYHAYNIQAVSHALSFYKKAYNENTPIIYPILEEAILLCKNEDPSVISENKLTGRIFRRTFYTQECQNSDCFVQKSDIN